MAASARHSIIRPIITLGWARQVGTKGEKPPATWWGFMDMCELEPRTGEAWLRTSTNVMHGVMVDVVSVGRVWRGRTRGGRRPRRVRRECGHPRITISIRYSDAGRDMGMRERFESRSPPGVGPCKYVRWRHAATINIRAACSDDGRSDKGGREETTMHFEGVFARMHIERRRRENLACRGWILIHSNVVRCRSFSV